MVFKKQSLAISAFEKRVRRHVTGRIREYFAVTSLGFESECRNELIALGINPSDVSVEPGGVRFNGRFSDCLRANLHLRTATRILMRISTFTATHVRQVEKKMAEISLSLFLPDGMIPAITVRARQSRLYHTGAIAQAIYAGMMKNIPSRPEPSSMASESPPQTLFVRVTNNRFVLSLDTSGMPLYKRGLKPGAARAPIRESLAAAILMAAGYDPTKPLVDPMCGSGTFSIEAAMMAKNMAPGMNRLFSFMAWPAFSAPQWNFLKQEALRQVTLLSGPGIFASDVDTTACMGVRSRITENRLEDAVQVQTQDFFQLQGSRFGNTPGCIVINPPYGVRIGSAASARNLFERTCGHLLNHFQGWRFGLIIPDPELARHLPFPARRSPFVHGGLKLILAVGKLKTMP